ncbi:MAG: accessory gene regulator B family protein [Lachnospiraceae bacterium]
MLKTKERRELTEREKKLREYYWKCFIYEVSKMIIFLLLFMCLGLVGEYFIALLTLMFLRSNGGGLHFNHYITCLLVSFAFLYGSIFLAQNVIPPDYLLYTSIPLCMIAGYYLVPITSSNRPPATPEQVQRCKKKTTIILFCFFILICLCPHSTYLYVSYWTIVLHIMQLFAANLKERRRDHAGLGINKI